MKIIKTKEDIFELLKPDGGKYCVKDLSEAYSFCRKITESHYENFPVGSLLIPKNQRKYFFSVYTFSRLADDIADELIEESSQSRIKALNRLSGIIKIDYDISQDKYNPLVLALQDTIKQKKLPFEPFEKLIKAFIMDSKFTQPVTIEDNLNYCRYSANPVGELVLRIFDNFNSETAAFSDAVCTGLQLVNFWQDISVDRIKGRIYLPLEQLKKYKLDEFSLFDDAQNNNLDACLKESYEYTENLFIFGVGLIKLIENKRLKFELALTLESGLRILEKVRMTGTEIIRARPELTKKDLLIILKRTLTKHRFF